MLIGRSVLMRESDDPRVDLEDLIYDEDAKTHSER